jgi:hypothetical protein
MHVSSAIQFTLTVTEAEFRLLTMGLANMLQDAEDATAALSLNTKLCHQRLLAAEDNRRTAEKALAGAASLENPNIPPFKKK